MTKYYRKDIPEMPVYVHGTPLKFEVLETSDAAIITELDKCIQFGRGGVLGITKEEFDEVAKKKPNETISESGYKQRQQRQELSSLQLNPSLAADGGISLGGGAFARRQDVGREASPHERSGLPGGSIGPAPGRAMPDPIDLPKPADLKPPTAKFSEVIGK